MLHLGQNHFTKLLNFETNQDFWNLKRLTVLELGNNSLTGIFNMDMLYAPLLQWIDLSYNKITEFTLTENNCDSVWYIKLQNNLLKTFPQGLCLMSKLQSIFASNNTFLSSIPSSLQSLTDLKEIKITNSSLQGTIPSIFHDMKNLRRINLANNMLVGNIETQFENLTSTSLEILTLHGNRLTGTLPTQLFNLKRFTIFHNRITGNFLFDLFAQKSSYHYFIYFTHW